MLFQLPLGVGILCLLFLLYYYDKQYQQANLIKAIEDELPQFLRLMAVTIRGGLSTNTALEEIVKRMPIGPLTNELSQVVQEMDLGLSRREALENWAERVKSEQVAFLVQSWMQSEELGTEPSEVLNFLADQLYDRKFRSVEAEAMKAGVKITIPLAFLIFPAVMIIIFGPILLGGL
jgi:tight adherence protein C